VNVMQRLASDSTHHCYQSFTSLPFPRRARSMKGFLQFCVLVIRMSNMCWQAATADSEVLALKWQPHDFALWANRRIFHSGTAEAAYNDDSRMFHLVFLDADPDAPVVAARE